MEDRGEDLRRRNTTSSSTTQPTTDEAGRSEVLTETSVPKKAGFYLVEIGVILFFPCLILQQLLTNFYFKVRITDELGDGLKLSKISVCGDNNINTTSPEYILQKKIQENLSSWQIQLLIAEVFLGMFVGLIIGPLTDHYGRKTGMLLSLFGSAIKFLGFVLTIKYKLSLWVIVAASACYGLSGGPGAFISSSSSYIADITKPGPGRTFRLSVSLSSASAIAGILAYFYGHIIHTYGHLSAAYILLLTNAAAFFFVLLVLSESLPTEGPKVKRDFTVGQIFSPVLLYLKDTEKKRRFPLVVSLVVFFLCNATTIARITFLNLYLINPPLCFDAIAMGMFVTITSVGLSFATLPVLKICQFLLPEYVSVIVNLLMAIVGNLLLSTANTSSKVYTAIAVGCGINVPPVMIEGSMSLLVEGHEQGTLFASTSFVNMLAVVVYSIVYNSIYTTTGATNPGFVFQIIAAILFLAIISELFLTVVVKKKKSAVKEQLQQSEKLRTD